MFVIELPDVMRVSSPSIRRLKMSAGCATATVIIIIKYKKDYKALFSNQN